MSGAGRSGPTKRVLGVLDALCESPRNALTAADLGRRVGLTSATCHAILRSLLEADYLVRNAQTKRYTLGPRALALGRAAEDALSPLGIASSELERLSTETQCGCSLRTLREGSIVVLARYGAHPPGRSEPGTSYPFIPPFGTAFVVWGPEVRYAEWVQRAPVAPPAAELERLANATVAARARGFLAIQSGTTRREVLYNALVETRGHHDRVDSSLHALLDETLQSTWVSRYMLGELEPGAHAGVSALSAPIFDHTGDLMYVVELHVRNPELSASAIDALGAHFATAVGGITEQAGGVDPWHSARPD